MLAEAGKYEMLFLGLVSIGLQFGLSTRKNMASRV
jgi:hypothetical protein